MNFYYTTLGFASVMWQPQRFHRSDQQARRGKKKPDDEQDDRHDDQYLDQRKATMSKVHGQLSVVRSINQTETGGRDFIALTAGEEYSKITCG